MAYQIMCDCGGVITADTHDDVVSTALAHAKASHELDMTAAEMGEKVVEV